MTDFNLDMWKPCYEPRPGKLLMGEMSLRIFRQAVAAAYRRKGRKPFRGKGLIFSRLKNRHDAF